MNKITLAREFESCETIENLGGFLKKIITHENTDYPQSDILEIRADFYNQCSLLLDPEEAYWRTILNYEISNLLLLKKIEYCSYYFFGKSMNILDKLCFDFHDRFDVFEMFVLLHLLKNFHERSIKKFKIEDEYTDIQAYEYTDIQAYLLTQQILGYDALLTNNMFDGFNSYTLNPSAICTVKVLINKIYFFIDQFVNNFIDEQQ